MICVNCNTEIDNDSKFCDSCGHLILICIKCKQPGVGKFCGKDGGKLIENPEGNNDDLSSLDKNNQIPSQQEAINNANTVRIQNNLSQILKLKHNEFELEVHNGDILGRREGKFVPSLAQFAAISGKHCQLSFNNGWFIVDLNSTNGISLNGTKIEKMKPMLLKNADEVLIADQKFTIEF